MLPSALAYLGLDPTSSEPEDLEKAAELLERVRPFIRYFHSSQYISDLANGEICVAVGFSGDIFIAADRAVQAGTGVEIAYSVPKEGAQQWFDMAAIPADAPNPEGAHAFLNFVMDPQISADITNYVWYANANAASMPLVDPGDRRRPVDLPAGRGAGQAVPDGAARRPHRPADHAALDRGEDRAVAGQGGFSIPRRFPEEARRLRRPARAPSPGSGRPPRHAEGVPAARRAAAYAAPRGRAAALCAGGCRVRDSDAGGPCDGVVRPGARPAADRAVNRRRVHAGQAARSVLFAVD